MGGRTIEHSHHSAKRGEHLMNLDGKSVALMMKSFLEMVQPLEIVYGYPRGVKKGNAFISYRMMGTSSQNVGIGNHLIAETKTFVVTVQTKTAEQNLLYSGFITHGVEGSPVRFVSEDVRRDVTVEDGWINTIILSVFNGLDVQQKVYPKEEVRNILQEIADKYIFVTSMYATTLRDSFIDRFTVPELEKEVYSYEEVLALKQQYIDRLLLNTTQY